jgi:1-aminocyclopropane-1-carboxylate deaminase
MFIAFFISTHQMIDLQFHSPIEEISDPIFSEKQVRVFMKRDDLIHPFISGNKWRKLKYVLRKAELENKKHLVTFGGAWSNHLLATACAGAKFGFKSTGIVRGENVSNNLLMLCKLFGMELKFTDRESYRDKKVLFSKYFSNDKDAFFIDEGGAGPEAVQGVSELVSELDRAYNHVFCPCGTGTTAAGIITGLAEINSNTSFHGVPVLKNGEFLRTEIVKYLTNNIGFELHSDYHFGGYAKITPELIQFIKKFSASTGILIDPVYTGKLLYAVYDLVKKDYFKAGSTILVIHTGGVFGLLGMNNAFD